MLFPRIYLSNLPVELLYHIHLLALSSSFPHTCKRIYTVLRSAPSSVHAAFILGRHPPSATSILTPALRYPICTLDTLRSILRIAPESHSTTHAKPKLPKRLFRYESSSPPLDLLPFLRFLYTLNPPPDSNSYEGYPLTLAVRSGYRPLIGFLLDHGADSSLKEGIAVKIAISRKDFGLVKMLFERSDGPAEESNRWTIGKRKGNRTGKKRKLEDRLEATREMLQIAVKCDARDIAEWLVQEKGCVPDMKTLRLMG